MGDREDVRKIVRERLYTTEDILGGTILTGSGTALLKDAANLESDIVPPNQFEGKWILVQAAAAAIGGEIVRVKTYDKDLGDFAVTPVFSATPTDGDPYEIHYLFRPSQLNDMISRALRIGTNQGQAAFTDDTTAQNALDDDVVAEGTLYFCRLAQARRVTGDEKAMLIEMAGDHLENFRQGCLDYGYEIALGRPPDQGPVTEQDMIRSAR